MLSTVFNSKGYQSEDNGISVPWVIVRMNAEEAKKMLKDRLDKILRSEGYLGGFEMDLDHYSDDSEIYIDYDQDDNAEAVEVLEFLGFDPKEQGDFTINLLSHMFGIPRDKKDNVYLVHPFDTDGELVEHRVEFGITLKCYLETMASGTHLGVTE